MKRLLSLFMLLALMAAILAACGTPAGTGTTPASPAPDTAASPEASPSPDTAASPEASPSPGGGAATGERPDDALGVVEIGPNDPIVLGYALVVAGPDAALGEDSRRGVELAIKDKGELLGRQIELVGEDTGCSPEGGQAAATRLASNTQIIAIVGTSCSSEARVLAPVIDQAGMAMVSPSNTAPDLTDPEKHVQAYLRTAHNDNVQGAVGAEFAYNELGLRRAATLHDGSLYAEQLANVFANRFQELGGEVVAQEAIGPQDTDMRPVLTRIASATPEILYYPIFIQAGGFITAQSKEVSGLEDVKLMGADGIFSPDFITAAGDAAQGMYLSSPDFSAFGGGYQEFLQKYQEEFGTNTTAAFHAHAYDAANMIMAAIESVAVEGADGTLYIGRQALRDALYATSGFQGLTGSITCDENGDCADPKIAVYEVVNTDPSSWSPGAEDDSNPKKIYP
jgi:branched-chain amino acid transport system substrate-binding protein